MKLKSRNQLGSVLEELGLNGFGIEIGVSEGNFSQILLDNTKLQKIYFLDAWKHFSMEEYTDPTNAPQKQQDRRYNKVVARLESYGERAEIIRGDCRDVVKDFDDEYFDFIYIDANHEYSSIKRDLADWYPKLKKNGLFAGHDYLTSFNKNKPCGVKQAVDEFCSEHGLQVTSTGGTRRIPLSWYIVPDK